MNSSKERNLTDLPISYLIDYRDNHLDNVDSFVSEIKEAPPYLLHVAHDVAFPNTWGIGYPRWSEEYRVIAPDEMRIRVKEVTEYVSRIHKAGVKVFIPYICNQTLGGNSEKRTGIWDFYDRWDDYSEFGIGPSPEADPMDWMARERDGRFHYNYEKRHTYFTKMDQYRFAPCMNNPYYNMYQKVIVSTIARVGYDGVFVDNCILNCYCQYCQEKFKKYMAESYSPQELKEKFGFSSPSAVELGYRGNKLWWVKSEPSFREFLTENYPAEELTRWFGMSDMEEAPVEDGGNGWLWGRADDYRKWMELRYSSEKLQEMFGADDLSGWGIRSAEDRALWAETKVFWGKCVNENLHMIKEAGASIRGSFVIVSNWGAMQRIDGNEFREEIGHDLREWAPNSDYEMYEEDGDPGMIARGLYLDMILEYKFALANGVRGTAISTRGSSPASTELAYAEVAAAGGGGVIQPGTKFAEIRAKYDKFFGERKDVLDGYVPYSDVAAAYFYRELNMENINHVKELYRLTRYLSEQHILFSYALEPDMEDGFLSRFRALILPDVRYMSDQQIGAVRKFVEGGGVLVVTGDAGCYDFYGKPRDRGGFDDILGPSGHAIRLSDIGKGRCIYSSSLSSLLPGSHITLDEALNFSRYQIGDELAFVGDRHFHAMNLFDRAVSVERYVRPEKLTELLRESLGYDPAVADPFCATGARFNAYRKPDSGDITLHAVNYNVTLVGEVEKRNLTILKDVGLKIRVPDGLRPSRVELLEPGTDPDAVDFEISSGTLSLTVPELRFYKLIHVCP